MKLSRTWLLKNARPSFPINLNLEIPSTLTSVAKNLLSIGPVTLTGEGYYLNAADRLRLKLKVYLKLVMPCAISLEPVDYPLTLELDQWFTFGQEQERDDLMVVSNDELDLIAYIWEQIYLSIPIKVTKPGAKLPVTQGENWRFEAETQPTSKPKIDPRLEKLKDFSKDK
jgi:uncharacterized protein